LVKGVLNLLVLLPADSRWLLSGSQFKVKVDARAELIYVYSVLTRLINVCCVCYKPVVARTATKCVPLSLCLRSGGSHQLFRHLLLLLGQ